MNIWKKKKKNINELINNLYEKKNNLIFDCKGLNFRHEKEKYDDILKEIEDNYYENNDEALIIFIYIKFIEIYNESKE